MTSKSQPTATVEEVDAVRTDTERAVPTPKRNPHSAVLTIVLGVALPCIPILAITSALLCIIFSHRINVSEGVRELRLPHNHTYHDSLTKISRIRHYGGTAAYYVHYNPTTITTIASWTSRVVPYLSSSIMALVAFFAARHMVARSKSGDDHGSQLPTPEQLSLLITMLGGSGFGPLKDTLVHKYRKKEKLMAPLPAAFSALLVIAFLAIIIPILDSWFGIATRSEVVALLTPTTENFSNFGRRLSSEVCPNGPKDNGTTNSRSPGAWWPCNAWILPGFELPPMTVGLYEASKYLSGVPTSNKVFNYTDALQHEYLYLGDAAQSSTKDFQATTIGVSAQCVPMTHHCYSRSYWSAFGEEFDCTPAFGGNLYQQYLNKSYISEVDFNPASPNVGVAFADDPHFIDAGGLTLVHAASGDPVSDAYNVSKLYPRNPLRFGAWAVGYPASNLDYGGDDAPLFPGDEGLYYDDDTGGTWIFNCSTTFYDIDYTWINGSVQEFDRTLASDDLAGMFSAPIAFARYRPVIQNAIAAAALTAGNSGSTSHAVATTFAREISKTMLAFSFGVMEPKRNLHEQTRELKTLARIPLVPLYLLLATKALYVLAVLVLAIGAYCFTHPAETELVRAQLSVKGLTAAYFNKPGMVQSNAVSEIQRRLELARHEGDVEREPEKRVLQRAATAPVIGTEHLKEAKVGLLPTVDGGWEFALLANGVWNSIKPVVKSLVEGEAAAGKMGELGMVVNAWH